MTDLSWAQGPTDVPLLDLTIGAALRQAAARWGDSLALVSRHQALRATWAQLDAAVDRMAAGLIAQGVQAGDRVGIWAPNCAEWAVIQFATARIGAILVTINPAYRTSEVAHALNTVQCSVLVTTDRFKTSDYIAMLREIWPLHVPGLRLVVTLGDAAHTGCLRWDDLARPADAAAIDAAGAALSPDDAINIQFTSGTTGLPKGATLTHRNILNNGYFTGRTLQLTPADRVCIPVPLYHCFGMVLGNLACITSGAAMVYPAAAFDPVAVLDAVGDEGCTALYGVPTMFIALLNHPALGLARTHTLRTGIMAGSPCPLATMQEVMTRLGMDEVTICYGMTETSPARVLRQARHERV